MWCSVGGVVCVVQCGWCSVCGAVCVVQSVWYVWCIVSEKEKG